MPADLSNSFDYYYYYYYCAKFCLDYHIFFYLIVSDTSAIRYRNHVCIGMCDFLINCIVTIYCVPIIEIWDTNTSREIAIRSVRIEIEVYLDIHLRNIVIRCGTRDSAPNSCIPK